MGWHGSQNSVRLKHSLGDQIMIKCFPGYPTVEESSSSIFSFSNTKELTGSKIGNCLLHVCQVVSEGRSRATLRHVTGYGGGGTVIRKAYVQRSCPCECPRTAMDFCFANCPSSSLWYSHHVARHCSPCPFSICSIVQSLPPNDRLSCPAIRFVILSRCRGLLEVLRQPPRPKM